MTIQEWLVDYLRTAGAVAGTIHQREGDGLRLRPASNIPERVQAVVRWCRAARHGGDGTRIRRAGSNLQPQGRFSGLVRPEQKQSMREQPSPCRLATTRGQLPHE